MCEAWFIQFVHDESQLSLLVPCTLDFVVFVVKRAGASDWRIDDSRETFTTDEPFQFVKYRMDEVTHIIMMSSSGSGRGGIGGGSGRGGGSGVGGSCALRWWQRVRRPLRRRLQLKWQRRRRPLQRADQCSQAPCQRLARASRTDLLPCLLPRDCLHA